MKIAIFLFILLGGTVCMAQSLKVVVHPHENNDIKLFSRNAYDVYLVNGSDQVHTVFDPTKIDRAWGTHKTLCTQLRNGCMEQSSWFVEFTNERFRRGKEVKLAPGDSLFIAHEYISIDGPGIYKFWVTHQQLKEDLAPDVLNAYGDAINQFTFFKLTSDTVTIPVSIPPILTDSLNLTYEQLANSDKIDGKGTKIIKYGDYTLKEILPEDWAYRCYKLTVRSEDKAYFHLIPLLKNVRWITFKLAPGDTVPACISQLEKLLYVAVQRLPKVKETTPIDIRALKDLPNLEYLSLWGTNVEKFPDWMGNYKKLKHLYLYGGSFQEYGPAIGGLSNLETLYLVASNGKHVPEEITKLSKLKDLTLMYCDALPKAIGKAFPQLDHLKIENYKSQEIPDFSGCTAKIFEFTTHPLKEYPLGLGTMTHLQRLVLSGNFGNAVFPDLSACTSLKEMRLIDQTLTDFPENIGKIKSLYELSMNTPMLKNIPESMGQWDSLNTLYINASQLQTLPESFAQCLNLRKLSIQKSGITEFPLALCNLPLEDLNLGWNKIAVIPPEIRGMTQLQTLFIAGNKLTGLPDELLSLPALHTVTFHANQVSKESVALYKKKYPNLKL